MNRFNALWEKYTEMAWAHPHSPAMQDRIRVAAHQEKCNKEFARFWFKEGCKSLERKP